MYSSRIYLPVKNIKVLDALVDKSGAASRSKVIEKIGKEFSEDKLVRTDKLASMSAVISHSTIKPEITRIIHIIKPCYKVC